jgi:hypothetical protein
MEFLSCFREKPSTRSLRQFQTETLLAAWADRPGHLSGLVLLSEMTRAQTPHLAFL